MLRKKLLASVFLMPITAVMAQDSTAVEEKKSPLTISGSVDGYYKYDFGKSSSNTKTSFTAPHNTFALGMGSIKADYKGDKIGAVVDLGFGPRAKEFAYTDDGITAAIKQLYVTYSPADWITFSLGTWGTHVGYEVLDPQVNRNYSMSYMFTNGPFSHTGFKAQVTKGKHSFMAGISNATDYRVIPDGQINRKFLLAQYGVAASEKVSIYLNYVGGKAPDTTKSNQIDAVVTAKISDKFSLGYNGTVAFVNGWDGAKNTDAKSWWGSALYLNVDPKPWFGLTLRGELFNDDNQLKTFASATEGGSIFAGTLSANFKISSLTIIPEIRVDNASESIFVNKDGGATKSATSLLVAAVLAF